VFGSLGAPELLIILAILVVLFGATRIGDIGRESAAESANSGARSRTGSRRKSQEPAATGEEKKS
jgi:Sec-independent protein translocase protein TatA